MSVIQWYDQLESCVLCGISTETSNLTRVRACFCGFSHEECVIRYVLRRELKYPNRQPACHLCTTPYRITPAKTPLVQLLENINYVWFQRECCIFLSMTYFLLFDVAVCTSGLFILAEAVGEEESLQLVSGWSPLLATNACRLATLATILANGFRGWEDTVLAALHRWSKAPYVGWLLPQGGGGGEGEPTLVRDKPPSAFCSVVESLMLPKIAMVFGHLFFNGHSNLNRFLLGGLTFLTVRGIAGIYYKHTLFSRQLNLTIHNYHQE